MASTEKTCTFKNQHFIIFCVNKVKKVRFKIKIMALTMMKIQI